MCRTRPLLQLSRINTTISTFDISVGSSSLYRGAVSARLSGISEFGAPIALAKDKFVTSSLSEKGPTTWNYNIQ
jgi:hypothetical protein